MKSIYAVLILLIVCISCKHKDDISTREIASTFDGYDLRMCVCCGGQYMRIENDTMRYRFFELPTPTGLPIDYGFARTFWIRYKPYEGGCSQFKELVTITTIRER
jgi:hypothetical protein